MGLFGLFKKQNTKQKIIDMFYSNYPEIPYISDDRDEEWIERALSFPKQSLVQKNMMVRYDDGLLPGHVYMLYWLQNNPAKKVPAYFEYKYGIDFEKEKSFLRINDFLDYTNKVTPKGEAAQSAHFEIISAQHPKPKREGIVKSSGTKNSSCGRIIPQSIHNGISQIPQSDMPIISREIHELNRCINLATRLAGIKADLVINEDELSFSNKHTYYEFCDLTPSGRKTKHPLTLHYATFGHGDVNAQKDYFGEVHYSRDGKISTARMIFWKKRKGFMIHLKTVDNTLIVSKVETSENFKWIPAYKCQ